MKDALATLGTIIGPNEARDAIHIAVIPARAGQNLAPGDHVILDGDIADRSSSGIGIVDPFLPEPVKVGEWFWVCLYPRTITSLRHVWTHPQIPDSPGGKTQSVSESEQWIRNWCAHSDCPDYETLMQGFNGTLHTDGYYRFEFEDYGELYLHVGAYDGHSAIPDEFWDHVENVTGKTFPRAKYFTCSC